VKNSTPPGADLAQHVGVAAELVAGEDLDLDAPLGVGLDRVGHLLRARVHRMA
jgi:hypothetical protein